MYSNTKSYKKYCIAFMSSTKNYIRVDDKEFLNIVEACVHLQEIKKLLTAGTLYRRLSQEIHNELLNTICICEQTFVEKVTATKLHPMKITTI